MDLLLSSLMKRFGGWRRVKYKTARIGGGIFIIRSLKDQAACGYGGNVFKKDT